MPLPPSPPALVRGGLFAAALSLAFAVACPPTIAQADPADVADRVRRRGDYPDQLPVALSESLGSRTAVFPGGASGGGGGGGAGERALGEDEDEHEAAGSDDAPRRERPDGADDRSTSSLPIAGGGSFLLWVGIAVLAAVFVFVLASLRPRGGGLASAHAPPAEDASMPAAPPGLTVVAGDPDELARAGRYEDAIAALLLAALRDVGWRAEGLMRSRTAREILASVGPGDGRHPPLAALVSIQERVAFGGEAATEERWRSARRQYALLTDGAGSDGAPVDGAGDPT